MYSENFFQILLQALLCYLIVPLSDNVCTYTTHPHCTDFDETFQKQLVSIRFPDPVSESSREWTVSTHTLPVEDRERLELVDNTISQ